jgi:hypothetical protein
VQEIADAMKQEGLLQGDARFENIDQILDGLEHTAGWAADLCNVPPLDVEGLRKEWKTFQQSVAKIPPRNLPSSELIRRHWDELKAEAAAQQRPVVELSSMMAVAAMSRAPETLLRLARAANRAVWHTGQLFAGAVLNHYSVILRDISQRGYSAYWADAFRPYLRAAAGQFSPKHRSLTARWLR